MNKRNLYLTLFNGVFLFAVILGILLGSYDWLKKESDIPVQKEVTSTQALMLMIEFEGTEGLINFVNDIKERDIPGVLIVSADFVVENCEVVNTLLKYHDIQLVGLDSSKAFWDVPYDEQLSIMKDTKEKIFSCTGIDIEIFGSRYFAYDENTVKAAQELGIDYVFARGTTGAKATIYKPLEYDVKIFSVSNVDSQNWGTGSLCDYSYWAREGVASDFEKELLGALKYEKISPVSHTYIGGLKKSWNDVYLKFFDQSDIDWVDLDTFGEIDSSMAFADIPSNREVQYETPHPAIPLDEEENISNPCAVEDISESVDQGDEVSAEELVIFHNGTGPMCIEALAFFDSMDYEYIEYLNTDSDYSTKLGEYRRGFNVSEGVSTSFGYYPIIFVGDRVFSGFNDDIKETIENIME
jgi:hypothetical protein